MSTQLLDHLNKGDADSRRRWSIAIAVIIIMRASMELIHTIAAGGESLFISNAGGILQGHMFSRSDLSRIYRIIAKQSRMNRKFSEEELNGLLS